MGGGGGSFWPFLTGMSLGRSMGRRSRPVVPGGMSQGSGGGCGGCAGLVLGIVVVAIIFALLSNVTSCGSAAVDGTSSSQEIAASTVEREKLPDGSAEETAYYTDADGGWISSPATLEEGLRTFYDETGVRPYVYILPNGQSTSVGELSNMATELYDELFDDEAHFLLVFCDDGAGSFNCGYAMGSQVGSIMDDEALGILSDYLDRYYQDRSVTEEEIFSRAFADTGERIMHVTTSPVVYIAIAGAVIVVAVVVFLVVRRKSAEKAREREHMEEVLNTPLESFGDTELDDLEEKYTSKDD